MYGEVHIALHLQFADATADAIANASVLQRRGHASQGFDGCHGEPKQPRWIGPRHGRAEFAHENAGFGGAGGTLFSINMVVTNTSTYTPIAQVMASGTATWSAARM